MDYHQNARLTVHSREALAKKVILAGWTLNSAAAEFNVSPKTAAKWVHRYRNEGQKGLADRSSRPHRSPTRTAAQLMVQVEQLRRQRWTAFRIAGQTGLSRATVSRILRRRGLNRWRALDPAPPLQRYERAHPGDLIHFDIKKLARIVRPGHRVHGDHSQEVRGAGWEYLHVAIDDHSRIAFAQILPQQDHSAALDFFLAARAHFSRFGFSTRAILTDNGSCYIDGTFRMKIRRAGLRHLFTRPYTPRTNGKAERFIQTALREWAYSRPYQTSLGRMQQLDLWLHDYNFHRPHSSLDYNTPASRSGLNENNLLSLHI
jgi:transposase InsO family protein